MVSSPVKSRILALARQYNHPKYFEKDPVIFPRHFFRLMEQGSALLQDVEIAGTIAAHLAWGRRDLVVRDTARAMEQMQWQPYRYVMNGLYRSDATSLHRTVKWSEFALICENLKNYYLHNTSLEPLTPDQMRVRIYGRKSDEKASNKKIHMLRRWMVRRDGIVDLGIWKTIRPCDLVIPLDVHVHRSALELGITLRKTADITTAREITAYLKKIFPDDPCLGDFALFAYAAVQRETRENQNKTK